MDRRRPSWAGAWVRLWARSCRVRVTGTIRWHHEHSVRSPGSRNGRLGRTSKPDPGHPFFIASPAADEPRRVLRRPARRDRRHSARIRVARDVLRRTPFSQTSEMITDNPEDSSGCRSGTRHGDRRRPRRYGIELSQEAARDRERCRRRPPPGFPRCRAGRGRGGAYREGTGRPGWSPSRRNRPRRRWSARRAPVPRAG
jgi:hypothetical protein